MRKSSASKIHLTDYDDLFGMSQSSQDLVIEVAIKDIVPFSHHPFKVIQDEKMDDLVMSIKERGVLVPCLVRPRKKGGYELIAGHRRVTASQLAGLETVKVLVKELDDDEATIIMVDSNIQRENLLFSERAFAYKMKFEAMKHQGSKSGKVTTEKIGEEVGESGRQIQRYIRLTELIEPLLKIVDDKKIGFIPAVDLSYLTIEEQAWVLELMTQKQVFPSGSQITQLKKYSETKELSRAMIDYILSEEKTVPKKVILSSRQINQYFPVDYSKDEIENVIFRLLDEWKQAQHSED